MRSGLTVSSYSRRLLRGKWRMLEYKCNVVRKRGVVHQSCMISAVFDEGLQQLIVHPAGTLLWNRAVYGKTRQLVIINALVVFADAVRDDLIRLARKIQSVAMGQVPAVREVHA